MRQDGNVWLPSLGCAVCLQSRSRCPPPSWVVHQARWKPFPRRIRTRIASGSDTGLFFRRVLSKARCHKDIGLFCWTDRSRFVAAFARTRGFQRQFTWISRILANAATGEFVADRRDASLEGWWRGEATSTQSRVGQVVCEHCDGGRSCIGSHSGCGITWQSAGVGSRSVLVQIQPP